MKLIFAAKEGNYLADVNITIKDSHDKAILEAVSDTEQGEYNQQ